MLLHPNVQLLTDLERREKFSSSIQKSINLVARWGSDAQTMASLGAPDSDLSRESPAGGCGRQGEMRWLRYILQVTLPPCRRRGQSHQQVRMALVWEDLAWRLLPAHGLGSAEDKTRGLALEDGLR